MKEKPEQNEGADPRITCPKCSSKAGLREIMYGLPDGPVDDKKYAIGGCCISDNDPTVKCIECGWKGDFVNHIDRMYAINREE